MALNLANYETKASEAIKTFWCSRDAAARKQQESGRIDQGSRGAVTAGKNMDGFIELIIDIIHANGLAHADILQRRKELTLPGYFRPTKLWDLLVINSGRLVAAIEFKSQVGPSFGNNFNNRTEEAIGTAADLWTAYREGAFNESTRPFVGWLMLLEDTSGSRTPVRDSSPNFSTFLEFQNASYADRYNLLCRRLMLENLYTAASVIVSPRSAAITGEYSELSEMTGLKSFITALGAHIAMEAARVS